MLKNRFAKLSIVVVTLCLLLQPSYAQQIKPDGFTATNIRTLNNGKLFEVTTKTIKGQNAFNSFSTFNLNSGYTANLMVPNSANNLINIVKNQVSNINGIVNTIKNGHVGGNLYFVNPNGIILGSQGVINTGKLTMITPTKEFVNTFFDSSGNPNLDATKQVINGYTPINTDAVITINGKTNTITDTLINTGTLNLNGDVYTGAVFKEKNVQLGDVVNIHTLGNPTNIAKSRGSINIEVAKDFNSHGKLVTEGGDYINAAPINIYSENDIKLYSNTYISASGKGVISNGDNIIINAKNKILSQGGPTILSGAGEFGNGGYIFLIQGDENFEDNLGPLGGVVKHGIRGGVFMGTIDTIPDGWLQKAYDITKSNNSQPIKPVSYSTPKVITINNLSSIFNNNTNQTNVIRRNGLNTFLPAKAMKYKANKIME